MHAPAPTPSPSATASPWHEWLHAQGEFFLLYARQQTRSEADARDVLQDALVETWQRAGGAIPDKALVLATIRRRAIDLGRSRDRRGRREEAVAGDAPQWFTQDFSASDTKAYLAEAVQALPEPLRETLVLRVWGDLSFPEIARLAGTPVATVASRYRYALGRLRESLAELQP
jgi:RNA polymerase sigma-70 factor, ECF subfamily